MDSFKRIVVACLAIVGLVYWLSRNGGCPQCECAEAGAPTQRTTPITTPRFSSPRNQLWMKTAKRLTLSRWRIMTLRR